MKGLSSSGARKPRLKSFLKGSPLDKLLELLLSNALGASGIVVVGWLVNKYAEQINSNINDQRAASSERHASLLVRVEAIENKYRDVLDIVLEKFSKWEDRISALLSKMGKISPEDLMQELDSFRKESESERSIIILEMEKVKARVLQAKAEPETARERQLILGRLDEVKTQIESRLQSVETEFLKVKRVAGTLIIKQKEHDAKLQNLIATRTKVVVKN